MRNLLFCLVALFAFILASCEKEVCPPDILSAKITLRNYDGGAYYVVDGATLDTLECDRNPDIILFIPTRIWNKEEQAYYLRQRYDFKVIIGEARYLIYCDDWRELERNGIFVSN